MADTVLSAGYPRHAPSSCPHVPQENRGQRHTVVALNKRRHNWSLEIQYIYIYIHIHILFCKCIVPRYKYNIGIPWYNYGRLKSLNLTILASLILVLTLPMFTDDLNDFVIVLGIKHPCEYIMHTHIYLYGHFHIYVIIYAYSNSSKSYTCLQPEELWWLPFV